MSCVNHPQTRSVGVCPGCANALCGECAVRVRDELWCRPCLESLVERSRATGLPALAWPSRLVAGLLSIVPGVGHMYLGFVGKGFAILGMLLATIFLVVLYSDATGMYWMTAYLVPTVSLLMLCYAVFDTLAIAGARRAGREVPPDPTMEAITERVLLNGRTLGWLVLVAGVLGVLELLERLLGRLVPDLGTGLSVTALVVPLVLLVIGVRLLWKGRSPRP